MSNTPPVQNPPSPTRTLSLPARAQPPNPQACAACKHQRRKCAPDCLLAPYFPSSAASSFLNAHKLFGVKKIIKALQALRDPVQRGLAARSIIAHANARAADPSGGCLRVICDLSRQIEECCAELALVQGQLGLCRAQDQIFLGSSNNNNNNCNDNSGEEHMIMKLLDEKMGFEDFEVDEKKGSLVGLRALQALRDPIQRGLAARSIIAHANARAADPSGGCLRVICDLSRQIEECCAELALVQGQLGLCRAQDQIFLGSSNNNNNNGNENSGEEHMIMKLLDEKMGSEDFEVDENKGSLVGLRALQALRDPIQRGLAARSIIAHANARAADPSGGCLRVICDLSRQIEECCAELALVQGQLGLCRAQDQIFLGSSNNNNNNGNENSGEEHMIMKLLDEKMGSEDFEVDENKGSLVGLRNKFGVKEDVELKREVAQDEETESKVAASLNLPSLSYFIHKVEVES